MRALRNKFAIRSISDAPHSYKKGQVLKDFRENYLVSAACDRIFGQGENDWYTLCNEKLVPKFQDYMWRRCDDGQKTQSASGRKCIVGGSHPRSSAF